MGHGAHVAMRHVVAILVVAGLLGGCDVFDDDEPDPQPSATATSSASGSRAGSAGAEPGSDAATGVRDVAEADVADASTGYVDQLCAVDPFAAAAADDPIGDLVARLRSVTPTTPQEQAELDELVAAFELARDDPANMAVVEAAGTMRARCSGNVVVP
jgi:hypothetical protein